MTPFDLRGKQAEWVTKTITFIAQGTEETATFLQYVNMEPQFYSTHDKYLTYMHAFVGDNAIVEIP
ncbi:hypothetical protein J2Y45_005818 [Dyadobacter sp. BE34]|uniref:Uncharacterized protein n=1 Tax=Dyadobacter fermentans TaxID=94254 RepID=A0ABU1R5D1_9BACT|nr:MULTISPECIES: hypothetical protein [Dyadobacter]MDR6808606.1 hypothetical protein [Dyadobacter fermentans]MDR7046349.1 hypothetical protein [Dyadobacter sp. BE242]MDR7200662.1 hypothetical protein [Dyadobacter sp. BE34]MDR7218622.1 hypothetical protein [Dyadobacter sp. BE31]MDR7266552.1 hypothetical protein [Dyadobacter sp. BE32]